MTDRSPRIGWIPASANPAVASTRLRCSLPCRYLREAGWDTRILDRRDPYADDLVVFQKIYDERAIELARDLRRRGVLTVFDLCDNHFYNPDGRLELTQRAERLRRMLDIVDAVSVSTEPLHDLMRERTPAVIADALDEFDLDIPERTFGWLWARLRRRETALSFVWYGNAGEESPPFGLVHLPTIIPELERLHRTFPLELTVISNSRARYEHAVDSAGFPTRYMEWNYQRFPGLFRRHHVCVIPVKPNPFTNCKTANRVVQSLRLGVPVIADPIPSFEEFAPFILLGKWRQSLDQYAADPALRARHVEAGRQYVEATYTKERVVSEWSSLFERVLSSGTRATLRRKVRAG